MALSPGSPVVNAGNPAAPTGSGGSCEVTDQRNQVRGAAVQPCDMGAFEVQRMSCTSFSMTIGVGQVTPVLLSCSGDPFVYSIATGPSHGALSGLNTATGAVTYTPAAGFSGTDSFTYRGVNGPIGSSPATVMFSVTGPAPSGPTPPTTRPGFNLKDAIRKCKRRVPKGPKRTKCIKKAKKRARNQ